MARENPAEKALTLLRSRLCDPNFAFHALSHSDDSNYSKLKFLVSSSIIEVLELVLSDLLQEYPDMISVIRLSDLLHSGDNCAFKCGLAHKTIIFVLDEFDLFALGKQRLLYSLLDAMQSVTSQAVVIGVSFRLDADLLLEKRVRSRFSQRKLLFIPPANEDVQWLLTSESGGITIIGAHFVIANRLTPSSRLCCCVNEILPNILADERFKEIINTHLNFDTTVKHMLRYLFCAVSYMDLESGMLSLENFKTALSSIQRQPKLECIKDCSILELYILVCMKRLEVKEQNSYNFNAVMKEYKSIHDSVKTSDYFARNVCLRAFETFYNMN